MPDQNADQLRAFKPAGLTVSTKAVTAILVIVFFVTLFLSIWGGGQLWPRIMCPSIGVIVVGCWLFSVKGYVVDRGVISVEHPFWSAKFEVRGLAPEDRRPGKDAFRLFGSNWIFGDTLGVCYSKRSGRFLSYVTNSEYKVAVETDHGVLVISPRDKESLAAALGTP